MKAFSPEAVRRVNWTLRLDHRNHKRVMTMSRHLFNQRRVQGFAPTFDVPDHWAPIVHGAMWALTRKVPEIGFLEVSEKDGGLYVEYMCDMESRAGAEALLQTYKHRIDLITQERLKKARANGYLEEDE